MSSREVTSRSRQAGFSLVELSVVLVIIGLIMGMATVSANLQRTASYNAVLSDFVLSWRESYNTYFDFNGYVVGDAAPTTGQVNGAANDPVCREDLLSEMADSGVSVPPGRARDREYLDLYTPPDNIQRQVEICFEHLDDANDANDWFVGPDSGDTQEVNVMVIRGLSTDLARKLDTAIDGYADAAWGEFRWTDEYSSETSQDWPELYDINGDIVLVDAYFRMSQ
ncbi:MAG: type II secretion system protein [Pseudomonadota bacterium]